MSVNAVHLIGLVAARPMRPADERSCELLLMTDEGDAQRRERHRIYVSGASVALAGSLSVAERIYVRGRLGRRRGRIVVVAHDLWTITPPPALPDGLEATATHASPHEHERREHVRRIAIGTPRERLVRVRSTMVRGREIGPE